jgi:hypothetical protein
LHTLFLVFFFAFVFCTNAHAQRQVLSALPFGDVLPRIAVDADAKRVYFAYFAVGVSYVDLDKPGRDVRVPLRWWSRTSPLVRMQCATLRLVSGRERLYWCVRGVQLLSQALDL